MVHAVAGGKDRHSKVAAASTTASPMDLASPQWWPSSLPLHGADRHGADPRRRPSPSLLAAAAAGASTTTTVTGTRSTTAGARSMAAAPAPARIHGGVACGGRYNTSLPLPLPSSPSPSSFADDDDEIRPPWPRSSPHGTYPVVGPSTVPDLWRVGRSTEVVGGSGAEELPGRGGGQIQQGGNGCVGGLGWERTGSLAGLRMGSPAGSWVFFVFNDLPWRAS